MKKQSKKTNLTANELKRSANTQHYTKLISARKNKKIIKTLLAIFIITFIGTSCFIGYKKLSTLFNTPDTTVKTISYNEPFYVLLIGIDKNQERAHSKAYGSSDRAYRSDSLILARVDAPNNLVTLVSIHRDTKVEINGKTQKINAAFAIGGPELSMQVVSEYANVPIEYYIEADFEGLESIVDTIGGVTINIEQDINDKYADAHFIKGEQLLNGKQALAICRARHAYAGDGDANRASYQRQVIDAVITKVINTDLSTKLNLISQLRESVKTNISTEQLIDLAIEIQNANFINCINPTTGSTINGGSYQVTKEPEWQEMMVKVNQGLNPEVQEEAIAEE